MSYLAAAPSVWTAHDSRLIIAVVLAIAVIVALIAWQKVFPFIALVLGSAVLGFGAGMPAAKILDSFESGLGDTTASVGVLIALGAILGKMLADSGGADRIVDTLVAKSGPRSLPWKIALLASIVGLPMFFEIGLVVLVPIILLVARRTRMPLLLVGIPALAGLSVLHGLVPPHPGPLVAIDALHANLGITLAIGLVIAIPTVIIAGPLFGILVSKRVRPEPPAELVEQLTANRPANRPSFGLTLLTMLLPIVLMLLRAVADIVWASDENALPRRILDFLGDPFAALMIAVLVAMAVFGPKLGGRDAIGKTAAQSIAPVAGILLIVAAGGGFKQVLVDGGVGDAIAKAAHGSHLSPLILAWLVAVGIRLATGSATVATVSAAGIVAPLAAGLDTPHVALLALALGCGSLFFSHVNDAGFWLVKEYYGMTVGETIRSWSVMETLISVVGIVLVLVAGLIL